MNILKIGILGLGLLGSSIAYSQEELNIDPSSLSETEEVNYYAEQMPYIKDCEGTNDVNRCRDMKIASFLSSSIIYPEAAKQQEVGGVAVVSYVIDKEGNLTDVKLLRDPSPGTGLGAEAVRVVELMGEEFEWEPAQQAGRTVPVRFNLPINFKF